MRDTRELAVLHTSFPTRASSDLPAFPFPSPLLLPRFDPPWRARMAIGAEVVRSPGARVDIGALESTSGSAAPIPMNGAQPLIPPSAVKPMAPAQEHPQIGRAHV